MRSARALGDDQIQLDFEPDGHTSVFSTEWLYEHAYDRAEPSEPSLLPKQVETWDSNLPLSTARYPDLRRDPSARYDWLTAIQRYGVARLSDCPLSDGAVAEVVELFGYVRETNYGRWFEVRSELNPVNLAYTGLGLQVHTDNPYRDPVPGLQLLLCLANDAEGGDSIIVDGFHAAQILHSETPSAFERLSRYPIPFEYRAGGDWLRTDTPMIECNCNGQLRAVHVNNRSLAALQLPFDVMPDYYAAYRLFCQILERPALSVRFKLTPGELFIVDNRRVLHGRTAFLGTGTRHLQGCYADFDALQSTLRMLRQ